MPGELGLALSLGEGATPLIAAGDELPGVRLKLEFLSPTQSFKDRGAVVLVAALRERGARRLVADSSGNAGSAIAAYATRAGLDCRVFVPETASPLKQAQIRAYGAEVERVAGDRAAAMRAALAAVSATGAAYASHVYDPYFLEGTKTFAFEIWDQLRHVPDAVIVPVGNGTLLLGAARGFRELRAAGVIERLPALVAVQSERCAPLALAWAHGASEPSAVSAQPTAAEGVAIASPPRGRQILAAVRETGGCALSVPESEIAPAQRELAARGLFVEPTAALVWAALRIARGRRSERTAGADDAGWSAAREAAAGEVVVPLCGGGL